MKKTTIMIDSDDDDDECRGFMLNAISEHSSAISAEIDVPIICLDDDDDDEEDGVNIDKGYKLFLRQLRDDKLGPLFAGDLDRPIRYEDDNGESETRKFKTFSGDSKRAKLENPKRVFQEAKRIEISRARTRESIERDNRIALRRKRRLAELEAERTSTAVPLIIKAQPRDNNGVRKRISVLKVETLRDVPISIVEEDTRRDKKARKISELLVESSRKDVPLVRTQENFQRDNQVRKTSELKDNALRDVPIISAKEDVGRDNNVESLRKHVMLVRIEEGDVIRDNGIAEPRKRKVDETKAVKVTSKVVPMELVNGVTEPKAVDETSSIVSVTQRNKGVDVGRRSVAIVDEDYMSYLKWLVDSLKEDSTNKPIENLLNDPSDVDPPILATLKESTTVPEKDVLVEVKVEPDLESCSSDDPDIIKIGDSPFLDGEGTPFVTSKTKIDLDKEDRSSCCLFRKELMEELSRPYDERELWELSRDASFHKRKTGCRELRQGREADYETDKLAPSYLDQFPDFNEKYERVKSVDKTRALKLLRGFFFYIKNVAKAGAFKPWELDG